MGVASNIQSHEKQGPSGGDSDNRSVFAAASPMAFEPPSKSFFLFLEGQCIFTAEQLVLLDHLEL